MTFQVFPSDRQLPTIQFQKSIKLRIACCNIDFNIYDGIAIEDDFLRKRILAVDSILKEQKDNPPHLIVFPEFLACELLLEKSKEWAKEYCSTVICGSYLNKNESYMKGVIVDSQGITEFYKKNLSPHDSTLTSSVVKNGLSAGCNLSLTTNEGTVNIKILICYDFYKESSSIEWENTQLVICPMYDPTWMVAQEKAHELAMNSIRTIIVNKPRASLKLDKSRAARGDWFFANLISRTCFVNILRLPFLKKFYNKIVLTSSAHGPLNISDISNLKKIKRLNRGRRSTSIWNNNSESVLIGSYELGLEATVGHQNRHNSGYNYEAFNFFYINDYLKSNALLSNPKKELN